ncbi:hypothetical protein QOZ80_2BG0157520 [Eleusine coracana subsp. coracana]|nr:hypothetical protein QOZ80_2BG0157520 [Eleusine coracana subsp. coracana]
MGWAQRHCIPARMRCSAFSMTPSPRRRSPAPLLSPAPPLRVWKAATDSTASVASRTTSSSASSLASPPRMGPAPPCSPRAGPVSGAPSRSSSSTPTSFPIAAPRVAPRAAAPSRAPSQTPSPPPRIAPWSLPVRQPHLRLLQGRRRGPRRARALAPAFRHQGRRGTRLRQPALATKRLAPPHRALQLRLPPPPVARRVDVPDTASLPRGCALPKLQELVLGCIGIEDRDLDFILAASPVLETLTIVGDIEALNARLASRSLRCAHLCFSCVEEVAVVDTPSLERLLMQKCWIGRRNGRKLVTRVKIGNAPKLSTLGYLEPGIHVLEIGNTVIKYGTKVSPNTTVPSVRMLALQLHFKVRNEVKMLPCFLRCFPNVETLCIQSEVTKEPTGNLDSKFWKQTGPIESVQSHLKTLVFREFQGEQSELDFLMYIAENARELKDLVIVLKLGRYAAPEEVGLKLLSLESGKWASGASKMGCLMSRLKDGDIIWSLEAGSDLSFSDPFLLGLD